MANRILLVTGDSGESYEALFALHRFQEAGYEAVVAAPSARRLHLVMHDFEPGWDTYIERQGYGLEADIAFDDVDVDDYVAVLLLGGRAPEFLRHIPRVVEIAREFSARGKPIFSICHGIQILVAADLVEGKTVTCYVHVRSEAERAGANYSERQAVRDGNLVSAQTWESHPEFYREVFACLDG
ncbi:MAG: DJ-1/PfpI family protein [Bryobacterales bacterium]|nr:DJ-1/PfpI family protein [Bryobacterales bacterium]